MLLEQYNMNQTYTSTISYRVAGLTDGKVKIRNQYDHHKM